MKIKLATAAAVLSTAMPSMGIIKMEAKSTLNNDGSAKFTTVVEIDLSGPMALMGQAGAKNPLGDGKPLLRDMMKAMGGNVDVWSEAKAELTKGGATRITLSGFTKDWRAAGDLKKIAGAAGGAVPIPLEDVPAIKFMDMKDDAAGNKVITMMGLDDFGGILDAARALAVKKGQLPKPEDMKIEKADIEQGLTQTRAQWGFVKGAVGPHVRAMSFKAEIEVSGTITEASVFKKTGDHSATFTFNGGQLMDLAEQIVSDEELPGKLMDVVSAVRDNLENEKSTAAVKSFVEPYLKTIYGGSSNPKIVFKAGENAFDYTAETEKAKAAQSEELKTLLQESGKSESKPKLPGSTAPGKKKAA